MSVSSTKKKKAKIMKFPTDCCALCQLSIQNSHTKEEIKQALKILRDQSTMQDWWGTGKQYGQKAIFVITTPNEAELADNLKAVGFRPTFNFERRKGYPGGQLTMWCINL